MKSQKKLPNIIITGTPQELVEIEPLLVMAGYNESKNNVKFSDKVSKLCVYGHGLLCYYSNTVYNNGRKKFKASEIHKILHYIETGEIQEYCEDMQVTCLPPIVKTKTHTGQAGVVGIKLTKDEEEFENARKLTISKLTNRVKDIKAKKWKEIRKEFLKWSNPADTKCICYYSDISQQEILAFFKKYFV